MNITDFSKGTPWAITPNRFETVMEQYKSLDGKQYEAARSAYEKDDDDRDYQLKNGIAIIPITGTISKRRSFFSFLFGGASTGMISTMINDALNDRDVEGILLDIDSPGGTVSGVEALSAEIFEANKQKPIVAFSDGMMTSAAYWLGSAASKVIAGKTSDVGSIGVLMVHWDVSESDKEYGYKRTYLTAGKYKAIGNDSEPLTEIAREVLQAELDDIYTVFVDDVARNRGVSTETALENMADGRCFIGENALKAGLVDEIGNMDTAMEVVTSLINNAPDDGRKVGKMSKKTDAPATVADITEMYPEISALIRKEGAESVNVDELKAESASAEQKRVMGLVNIQFGADDGAKFQKIVESGVTVEQFEAVFATMPKVEKTESKEAENIKKQKDTMLDEIKKTGADNPGVGKSDSMEPSSFDDAVTMLMSKNQCGKGTATSMAVSQFPKLHEAFLNDLQPVGNA